MAEWHHGVPRVPRQAGLPGSDLSTFILHPLEDQLGDVHLDLGRIVAHDRGLDDVGLVGKPLDELRNIATRVLPARSLTSLSRSFALGVSSNADDDAGCHRCGTIFGTVV